ncbi:MAG: TetR/AcrR family transcriptional regulator [Planctomycetales bacterium]|nr:TetR/AcrR family transcriptional regulator [bacterium]UNM07184.1 MAG: TetR/AcrR family transcriptional regulator [Planctomycetales bacterium]
MPRNANNRELILDAAWSQLWQHGYHAMSISDVAKAAKLPKGSIYNYFQSKEELAEEALLRLRHQYENTMRVRVLSGTISPAEIIRRFLDYYEQQYAEVGYGRGDPLMSRLNELADTNPDLASRLAELADVWRSVVAQKIWGYATAHHVQGLVDHAESIAGMIHASLQGVLLNMKVRHSAEPIQEARRILPAMMDSYVTSLAAGEIVD